MRKTNNDLLCFNSIELSEPIINSKNVSSTVILNKINGEEKSFKIILNYETPANTDNISLYRIALFIPLLNYGLFSKEFILDFPLTESDMSLLNELNLVFSRDTFVNNLLRQRANFVLPEFLPNEKNVDETSGDPKAKIKPKKIIPDNLISNDFNKKNCGILSSGGKESLLTYSMLKEIGCNVFPLYVNESGGHWRTALTAYNYHKKNEPNTKRVWTNVDRFYNFMLDNLKFIRPDHRKVLADVYAIRMCIFPYYVFSLLPLFTFEKIGNLLIGSEFDDLRNTPEYHNIPHYYGVYDQHQDYDIVMNRWYEKRLPGLVQWSAVRNISGLIVERILVNRYPKYAKLQRSCHSCHIEKNEIVPCGKCSKCMGVLLFLLANKSDPTIMNFNKKDVFSFSERVEPKNLRLDQDERDQSFYLMENKGKLSNIKPINHVEKIHFNDITCDPNIIPATYREKIFSIFEKYTSGYCELKNEKWVDIKE